MSSELEANMHATATAFVMDFDPTWRGDSTQAQRAPECVHSFLPGSLGIQDRSNPEFQAYFGTLAPLIKSHKVSHGTQCDTERWRIHAYIA